MNKAAKRVSNVPVWVSPKEEVEKREKTIYQEKGFENRNAYLMSLVEEYGIEEIEVFAIANMFGPVEDFDGLITALEDIQHDVEWEEINSDKR